LTIELLASPEDNIDPVVAPPAYFLLEFKGHRRSYFLNTPLIDAAVGDIMIIEADRGEDAGTVRALNDKPPCGCQTPELSVIRKATSTDLARIERLRKWETEALNICKGKVATHRLQMSLVDAEYRFDELKLTFFFTADGRIDFRELVRDLASSFRTRIELRQIGARDEVKRGDGFGVCGRRLCCVSFMDSFQPITTIMAKSQKLILNPTKLSGACGRLKCCLAFESDNYSFGDVEGDGFAITVEGEGHIEHLSD